MIKLLVRAIPNKFLFAWFRRIERRRFQSLVRSRLGADFVDVVDIGPPPPARLIQQTAALNERAFKRESNPDCYFTGGFHVAANWCRILDHFGVDLRSLHAIYEIGCGTCRLLRHFRCFRRAHLVGSDINAEMVAWSRDNVPGIEIHKNELRPPLEFAETESFDLVLALSVFTHIPIEWQADWIRELKRVIKPGGILLCTVAGKNHERLQLNEYQKAELAELGQLTLRAGDNGVSMSTNAGGSKWDVFQTREQIIGTFGTEFDLIDTIDGGQDLLILQKPGGGHHRQLNPAPYGGVSFASLD